MSLLSKIKGFVKKAAPLASFIPGPIGVGATIITGINAARQAAKTPAAMVTPSMPGIGTMGMFPSMSSLGRALPGLGAVGTVGRAAVGAGRKVYSAAANYCRKHPGWCQTVGGIAAVEAMINSGQLPLPKRSRGRGITATELKNFKRVARFTSKYCAPVRRAMSAPAVRRGRSACR